MRLPSPEFWRGRRVLLTGHTGFKGSWTALWLERLGAEVYGLALPAPTEPSHYALLSPWPKLVGITVDLRDAETVSPMLRHMEPGIILHMAAQALVRRSYREPIETIATNVQGTAHLLEAARALTSLEAILVVTSDKVYENHQHSKAFTERDGLGGHDPYSASKAATEIITRSFALSFFNDRRIPVATARAGNVIGGGDFSEDRLIPDIIRAHADDKPLMLRYPQATRPWQHVLDCICGYLLFLEDMVGGRATTHALNFGPDADDADLSVGEVVDAMHRALGRATDVQTAGSGLPREMATLALDSSCAREALGWRPRWRSSEAIKRTANWYGAWRAGAVPRDLSVADLAAYEARP